MIITSSAARNAAALHLQQKTLLFTIILLRVSYTTSVWRKSTHAERPVKYESFFFHTCSLRSAILNTAHWWKDETLNRVLLIKTMSIIWYASVTFFFYLLGAQLKERLTDWMLSLSLLFLSTASLGSIWSVPQCANLCCVKKTLQKSFWKADSL